MSDLQIYFYGLYKMPWLLIIPIAIICTSLVEVVNKNGKRGLTRWLSLVRIVKEDI